MRPGTPVQLPLARPLPRMIRRAEFSAAVSGARLVVALVLGLAAAASHPTAPALVVCLFCIVFAWHLAAPSIWVWLIPAALPVLNFMPWSGRIWLDEFDVLVLACVAGGTASQRWMSCKPEPEAPRSRAGTWFLAAVWISLGVGLWRGLPPFETAATWDWQFGGYDEAVNSLRVGKALLWIMLLLPMLRQIRHDTRHSQRMLVGLVVGLALAALLVLDERYRFPGIWDFSAWYRAVGPFWEMHVGGAAIDVYLALVLPAAVFLALERGAWMVRLLWGLVAALGAYAVLVTFSRGLLVSALISMVVMLILREGLPWRRRARVLLGALAAVVVVVWSAGAFMTYRISLLEHDLTYRMAQWRQTLSWPSSIFDWTLGMGLGRAPTRAAAESELGGWPVQVRWVDEGDRSYVRLHAPAAARPGKSAGVAGAAFGLVQRVAGDGRARPYSVELDFKAPPGARLRVRLCEQHLLYSATCQSALFRGKGDARQAGGGQAGWSQESRMLTGRPLNADRTRATRGLMLWVEALDPGTVVHLRQVRLLPAWGPQLVRNDQFKDGLAHWLPSAQHHFLPWHIDSHYLELLVERGALGLGLFGLALAAAFARLWNVRGDSSSSVLAASLVGGAIIGVIYGIQDSPRVAFLLFWLITWAFLWPSRRTAL